MSLAYGMATGIAVCAVAYCRVMDDEASTDYGAPLCTVPIALASAAELYKLDHQRYLGGLAICRTGITRTLTVSCMTGGGARFRGYRSQSGSATQLPAFPLRSSIRKCSSPWVLGVT